MKVEIKPSTLGKIYISSPPPCQIFRNQYLCSVLLNRKYLSYCQLALPHARQAFFFCYAPLFCPALPRAIGTGMQLRPTRTEVPRGWTQPCSPSSLLHLSLSSCNNWTFASPISHSHLPMSLQISPPIFTDTRVCWISACAEGCRDGGAEEWEFSILLVHDKMLWLWGWPVILCFIPYVLPSHLTV